MIAEFLLLIFHTAEETLYDIAPILAILVFFQLAILRRPLPNPRRIAIGTLYVFIGMTLFIVGLEEALFPVGRTMATQLTAPEFVGTVVGEPDWRDYWWVYLFALAVGFAATIAEPALIAISIKAHQISGGAIPVIGLRIAVACGVAFGVALGTFRIVTGTPLSLYISVAYVIVVLQTIVAPKMIIPIAYDSGGVATSTVTVPVITALGLGLASTIPGRSTLIDGFGLIAFACLFPIMSVLTYAMLASRLKSKGKSNNSPKGSD
jgi:hypothetical protein